MWKVKSINPSKHEPGRIAVEFVNETFKHPAVVEVYDDGKEAAEQIGETLSRMRSDDRLRAIAERQCVALREMFCEPCCGSVRVDITC